MLLLRGDIYQLRAGLRALDRATFDGARVAACTGAAVVAHHAERLALMKAEDTGRYRRAWGEAYNQCLMLAPEAGQMVGPAKALPAIRESRFRKTMFRRLESQSNKYEGIESTLVRQLREERARPSPNKGRVRFIQQRLDRVGDVVDKLIEQMEAIDQNGEAYKYAVTVGGRKTRGVFRRSNVDTVFLRVYGGSAAMLGGTVCQIRNMEPHARMVAKRTGIERQALAALRLLAGGAGGGAGIKSVGAAYVARLRKGSGVAISVGTQGGRR